MAENYTLLPESLKMYTQTVPLKEVKDMSKNLVSGDFERDYRGGVKERCWGKQWRMNALALAVGALAGCLLVLTVVREVQISRLRSQVEELSANMIVMTASIDSLKQKLLHTTSNRQNRFYNDFKTLDDTIYTDDDGDSNIPVEDAKNSEKQKEGNDTLEKLHGLTVLEDEDDEDVYDDDEGEDVESGDWYQDYAKRSEKIGTTNMVRLKPEDFTNNVVAFGTAKQPRESSSVILDKITRMINEDPGNKDLWSNAILFSEALQAEAHTTTSTTAPTESEPVRPKRSVFADSITTTVDHFVAPRIVAKSDERRKTKKYSPTSEPTTPAKSANTVSRIARNSENEVGKPFIAAHFHGNTSHLNPEIHEHYKGNGLVRVAHEAPHDVWYPSPWTLASPHPRPTLMRNGHIHVHHTGVYLVYVQIYYLDTHDIISWVLHRTNPDSEGRDTLLQCAQSSHSAEPLEKPNSCFSAAALFLKAGDKLAVRNTGGDRHSLMQPEKSFIGLIKLADAEDPNEEF